jgi:hypothetical protein
MASTIAGLTPENYEKYRANRLYLESRGNYTVVNELGFSGGYQMGAAALETVGLLNDILQCQGLIEPEIVDDFEVAKAKL